MGCGFSTATAPFRLSAAETLDPVTVICADKTGTLTQNSMRAEVIEIRGVATPIETCAPSR